MESYLKTELYDLIKKEDTIFDFIQESSLDGLWYWDLEHPENEWMNARFWKTLGYDPDEMPHSSSSWQNIINQDDLKVAFDNFTKHLENPNHPYDQVVRYTHKDGSIVWIQCRGMAIRNKEGKPIRMLGAHHNITELKKAEERIIASKEKAEENDRLKTAFLQNMSHEIRTPMNAIMGFSELLIRDFNDKSKLTHYTQIISQRCSDLLVIIGDILDIAKIESGQLPVNIEKCNLNLLFLELKMFFKEHQVKIKKQHVGFRIQTEKLSSNLVIETDKVKLKQILINLIGNAFKFTYEGRIEAGSYFDSDNTLVFYVSDTGLGIHPDKHEQIFERFIQIDSDAKRSHGGTGLGLSIVKGLVDLLGGKIWLESQPGEGSTFFFTIKTKFSDELLLEPLVLKSPMKTAFDNKTILIVEDDIFNAEYLKLLISGKGMQILQTETGREAVEISLSKHVDLVFMDIQLADMNGYDAILEIKKHKPDQKIIVQSAYAASEDKIRAFEAGCTDYISKPLKSDVLFSMLNKYLN